MLGEGSGFEAWGYIGVMMGLYRDNGKKTETISIYIYRYIIVQAFKGPILRAHTSELRFSRLTVSLSCLEVLLLRRLLGLAFANQRNEFPNWSYLDHLLGFTSLHSQLASLQMAHSFLNCLDRSGAAAFLQKVRQLCPNF